MAWEVTRIVAPFWTPGVYLSPTRIMALLWATPILCQMQYTSVQVSYLWFPACYHIWPRASLNSGPRNDSNSGCILALQHLFESSLNNCPSPSHSNLVSDGGVYICSGLLLMISWWVPYLPKDCKPDFNNGSGGDSNSGPVLPPSVYLSLTRIMAIQAIPVLNCKHKLARKRT